MSDVVDPRGQPLPLEDNPEFISDFARYCEGILDEKFLRRKYRFDDSTWESLGNDDALVEKIENEKLRRIRDGTSARERAQVHFATAPDVLGSILNDQRASPRHRIESAKELRTVAANGPEAAPAADRFQIVINLGEDVLRFDKSIAVDANDRDPNEVKVIVSDDDDTAPQKLLPVIATNKRKDDGSGQPV
jgi:hypothetical protein